MVSNNLISRLKLLVSFFYILNQCAARYIFNQVPGINLTKGSFYDYS